MKVVAVSQRVDAIPERGENRDALDQRLSTFITECGGLAVPVPNALTACNVLDLWLDRVQPAAIILSGGNDIGQCLSRDLTERHLLDHALKRNLPVLGICRGMQMMAVWAGGGLKLVDGHVQSRHLLSGEIAGTVNSFHNFSLDGCPDGFNVLATSEDGEIEAVRHHKLRWEGWMWHPERCPQFASSDINRLKGLLQ